MSRQQPARPGQISGLIAWAASKTAGPAVTPAPATTATALTPED